MTGRTHQGIEESVTGIVDVSDELIFREISRPMSPETLVEDVPDLCPCIPGAFVWCHLFVRGFSLVGLSPFWRR